MANRKSGNNGLAGTNGHFKKASRLYELALSEMRNATKKKDVEIAQDAAGKAWLSAIEYLKGYWVAQGAKEGELPESSRGRWYFINTKCSEKVRKLIVSIYGNVHVKEYYDGVIDWRIFPQDVLEVGQLGDIIHKELIGEV